MYCYTYVNNFNCVLNEILLWSDISSEHPIFIKTVAKLTNKNLSKNIIDELSDVNKKFSNLKRRAEEFRVVIPYNIYYYIMGVKDLINNFLINDRKFISLLGKVKEYGKEDKVWQTLLEHITEEQKFMYDLFIKINMQLI